MVHSMNPPDRYLDKDYQIPDYIPPDTYRHILSMAGTPAALPGRFD